MLSNPASWFEIPVHDLERAALFYSRVIGLPLYRSTAAEGAMAWFPMQPGLPGAGGRLMQGPGYVPSREGAMIYLSVTDLDAALTRVCESGGTIEQGCTSIGEYGTIAIFIDTEGNRVALHAKAPGHAVETAASPGDT